MNWMHPFWQVPYKVCMDGWKGLGAFLHGNIFVFIYNLNFIMFHRQSNRTVSYIFIIFSRNNR